MDIPYRLTIILLILVVNYIGVGSQSISLQGSGEAIQDKEYTLECNTTSQQTVNWYKGPTQIAWSNNNYNQYNNNGCRIYSQIYSNYYMFKECGVKHKLTIKSIDYNSDNGKRWMCQINDHGNFISSNRVTVSVTIPVNSVDITSTDLNLSTITKEENQQISIQCVTSFASPEPVVDLHVCNNGVDGRCNIYRTTKYSENKTSIIFQVTLNSTLEIDDTRLYCTANNTDTEIINSSSVTLYILHRPRVRVEEDEGKLLCIAVGRPENMTFLPWKHSIDNKLVREIEGYYINTTVYSLNITNNQNNDGNYTCTVNNGISEPSTKQLNQIAYYNLDLKVQPNLYNIESNNNLVIGQNGEISLKYLEDKTVNVLWYTNDTNVQTNKRITIIKEPTEISHPYNNNIKLSGIKTILTITSIVITDQGNYSRQVCNQYGCSSKTFEMDVVSITEQQDKEDEENENMTVIVAVVVSILVVVLLLVGVFIIIKYRKYKASKRDENRLYESTVPTPATIYAVIGSSNPYVNDQTLPVYYNTTSDGTQNIIIGTNDVTSKE